MERKKQVLHNQEARNKTLCILREMNIKEKNEYKNVKRNTLIILKSHNPLVVGDFVRKTEGKET